MGGKRAARAIVAVAFVVSFTAFAASAWFRVADLSADAHGVYGPQLRALGLPPAFLVWYFILTESLIAAAYAAAAAIIAWRATVTRVSVLATTALLLYGVAIPPPMHALVIDLPPLPAVLVLERSLGIALFVVFLYLFPDGRYTSWFFRALTPLLVAWALAWPFVPALNPYDLPEPWPFAALCALFATGTVTQLYRYFVMTTPRARQQTKWVVYGITASVLGDFVCHAPWWLFGIERGADLVPQLVHQPFFVASQLAAPLGVAVSTLRYGLWEIDFVINRTVVYGLVTTVLAAVWAIVNASADAVFERLLGTSGKSFASGSAVLVTGLVFKPIYDRLSSLVDDRLSPRSFDSDREFPEFSAAMRDGIPLQRLLHVLVAHTADLLGIRRAAVYVYDEDGTLDVGDVRNVTIDDALAATPDAAFAERLRDGNPLACDAIAPGGLAVPLLLPRLKRADLVGMLVLGARGDGRGYSSQDGEAFKQLGVNAGTAIYLAQLREAPTRS
jgi:hypothetical protein